MATAIEPNFAKIYHKLIVEILGDTEKSFKDDLMDGGLFNQFLRSDEYYSHVKPPSGTKLTKKLQSNQRKKTGAVKEQNQEFNVFYLEYPEKRAKYGVKAVKKLHEAGVLAQLGFPEDDDYSMLLAEAVQKPRRGIDHLRVLLTNYWLYPTFYVENEFDDTTKQHSYPTSGYPIFQAYAETGENRAHEFESTVLAMCNEMRFEASKGLKGPKEAVRIFMEKYRHRFNFKHEGHPVPRTHAYITLKEPQYVLLEKYIKELEGYDYLGIRKAQGGATARLQNIKIKKLDIGSKSMMRGKGGRPSVDKNGDPLYWC